jgi:phosphatidylethanolamine-binding protein (PEBP) family uncharacterized protein
MKFAFNKQCVLEHVNVRKGKNEGCVPQFDLKFSCEMLPAEAAAVALGARSTGEVEQAMFATKEARFKNMGSIPIDRNWEGQHMLRMEDLSGLRVVKLHKVKLVPGESNAFGATFTLTVEDPDAETLHTIMSLQHESVQVNLEHDRKDLADQADQKTEEKKGGKVKKTEGADAAAVH